MISRQLVPTCNQPCIEKNLKGYKNQVHMRIGADFSKTHATLQV